jgi:hypothetical protein
MTDEELMAQAAGLTPVYVDGFGAFQKKNGVFICIGHFNGMAIMPLVISISGAKESNERARKALLEQRTNRTFEIWEPKTAH